jgi:hypothetical protein
LFVLIPCYSNYILSSNGKPLMNKVHLEVVSQCLDLLCRSPMFLYKKLFVDQVIIIHKNSSQIFLYSNYESRKP